MTRQQFYALAAFAVLFLCLLFGFQTKPKKLLKEERTRSLNIQATDIEILRKEAFDILTGSDKTRLQILESQIESAPDSAQRLSNLKELSSIWFGLEGYSLAGYYAEEIALIEGTAEAWGIAGTTYALGANRSIKQKEQQFCRDKALESLENAISLNPDNLEYQINRGVVFAEYPDPDNPMKGIQLLLGLNKNFPENVSLINNLARFAIQTNQLDRALERLTEALRLEPDNITTHCLLVRLYERQGDTAKMNVHKRICEK